MIDSPLCRLSEAALRGLADSLESGRLKAPFTTTGLQGHVPPAAATAVAAELDRFVGLASVPSQMAHMVRLLADQHVAVQRANDRVELVWTGPEVGLMQSRDTAIVVADLFRGALRSVLISGFTVLYAREIFEPLTKRMEEIPSLRVRMFLNVIRPHNDQTPAAELVANFAVQFFGQHWPGTKRPELFHDPRSLHLDPRSRASLHAKCVVVDEETAFVTSANFTEAAHSRNIEAGILVRDPQLARSLISQFEGLVGSGALVKI
jgi:hypothetical protein